ncbi:sulfurtransferase [Ornithinibacillus xuwenensis]|uniref:Sulfurtransferase n=1 Tax=Ornithinibacillus xuwenensis TaxID=3144668 RepID=A0ABU9XKJ0_9BACI
MSYLISVEKANEIITHSSDNVVVVDVRYQLQDKEAGKRAYEKAHIPGAVYFDLEKDLSNDDVGKHGGNHPLPDMTILANKLGDAGIDQTTTVVVYDQANDMFSSRFWWLLHYMGHDNVYILDGGYEAWGKAGNSVTAAMPNYKPKTFKPNQRYQEVVDMQRIRDNIKDKTAILIDSRSPERYLGKTEPLYKKAGHIPGAKNYFWMDVLHEDGSWKTSEELEQHFGKLDKNAEIIVSCGSGVSACPNIIGLKMAGYQQIKLYPGSFSDWISYDDNKVETKDENE